MTLLAVLGCDAARPAGPAPQVTRAALPLGWQVSELRPDRGWDWIGGFGRTMDFDGERIIVGAPQKDDEGEGSGAAYVFVRDGAGFRQQAKLVDPDKGPLDRFGSAVSISGDFAFVGAPFYEDNVSAIATDFGALHVYQRAGDSWRYRMRLRGSVLHQGDQLGHGWESALLLYERRAGSWSGPTALMATDDADAVADRSTGFGQGLAIQGNTLLVGAPFTDVHGEDSRQRVCFRVQRHGPARRRSTRCGPRRQRRLGRGLERCRSRRERRRRSRHRTRCGWERIRTRGRIWHPRGLRPAFRRKRIGRLARRGRQHGRRQP